MKWKAYWEAEHFRSNSSSLEGVLEKVLLTVVVLILFGSVHWDHTFLWYVFPHVETFKMTDWMNESEDGDVFETTEV